MLAAQLYYFTVGGGLLFLWGLAIIVTGQDITKRGMGCPLALLPSWCPKKFMQFMLQPWPYLALYHVAWISLIIAGFIPHLLFARVFAACTLTLYVFAETAVTHGHRDHANVYTAWALALLPACSAEGVSLGVCVFMMASSGYSKILVGGAKWAEPDTLRIILNDYKDLPFGVGPGSQALCQWCVDHDWILILLNFGTLFFECVLAPAALVMPPHWRFIMVVGSVGLHIGICVVQSFGIGLAFLPGLASYMIGYGMGEGEHVQVFSQEWIYSLAIFGIPTLYMMITRKVLPEDFPLTPYALFPWNSCQWALLDVHFVKGSTRLVLATDDVAVVDMPGLTVLNKWGVSCTGEGKEGISASRQRPEHDRTRVFDAWDQIIGQTLVFNPVLHALEFDDMCDDWNATISCRRIEQWLRKEQPFFEVSSGMPLLRCCFVLLDESMTGIAKVLSSGLAPALLEAGISTPACPLAEVGRGQREKAASVNLPTASLKQALGRAKAASSSGVGTKVRGSDETTRARIFSYP